jgi:SpoVK/Ycf46/Vps4 family AAA+-type ATPase
MLREEKGLKQSPLSLHLVFSGNPGTGKTTVARILGKIYYDLGILSKGHLIETDRSGLVAGYIGQTAIQTKNIIERAKGGILFIDEAYSLTPQNSMNDFGQEAIDTLLKAMEDYRDDFIVIVAGYPDLMKNFIKSNPGLESRFNTFINFEDYNPNELLDIFLSLCKQHNYITDTTAIYTLTTIFQNIRAKVDESYANARTVRNFFENSIKRQANRLVVNGALSKVDLQTLVSEDFYERQF